MNRFEQRVRRRLDTSPDYRAGFEEGVAEFNLATALDEARQERHLTKAELARRNATHKGAYKGARGPNRTTVRADLSVERAEKGLFGTAYRMRGISVSCDPIWVD